MENNIALLVLGVILLIVWFVFRTKNKKNDELIYDLRNQILDKQQEKDEINELREEIEKVNIALESENKHLHLKLNKTESEFDILNQTIESQTQKIQELTLKNQQFELKQNDLINQKQELQAELSNYFEQLAQKIFKERDKEWRTDSYASMQKVIEPFQQKLHHFEQSIQNQRAENNKLNGELKGELNKLMGLNQQISNEAASLVSALKGENKTQGDWGEYRLEMLLQNSGLKEHIHYSKQNNFTIEGVRKIPDFIIHLPENKSLILDSKVSLTAYERYHSSTSELEKTVALKEHQISIKNHIKQLSSKQYERIADIQTVDYVLLFVAVEPALFLAADLDPELYDFALSKNVVLVSHSTLLATLRTISHLWKQEDQRKNIQEIVQQASAIYDQVESYVSLVDKMGNQLETVNKTQQQMIVKLSGRQGLANKVERIKKLGIPTKKQIDTKYLDHGK
ncbi:MAG: DNA recombination protein RmuC [Flavobacteriales bacterium]